MSSAAASAAQKPGSSRPASIAPGIATMIALSTISMIAIETVSLASAIGTTDPSAMPERSSGSDVSE